MFKNTCKLESQELPARNRDATVNKSVDISLEVCGGGLIERRSLRKRFPLTKLCMANSNPGFDFLPVAPFSREANLQRGAPAAGGPLRGYNKALSNKSRANMRKIDSGFGLAAQSLVR